MAQNLPAWITAGVAIVGVVGALWRGFTAISTSLIAMNAKIDIQNGEIKRLGDKIDSHRDLIAKDLEDGDRRLTQLEAWRTSVEFGGKRHGQA